MKTSSLSAMAFLTSRSLSSRNNFLFRFRPYHFLLCSSSSRTVRSSSARSHSTIITAARNNNENMKNHYQSTLLQTHLERLKSSPSQTLLLDGGTGEELFLRGVPDDRKIWSATAVVHSQHHSILRSVHESFIEAGSDAITTNSYGIVPGVGFRDGEEVVRLMGLAGEIARKAATAVSDVKADESGKNNNMKKEGTARALVLGSLGPLVESYRPDLIMNRRDGVKCYRYAIEGLYPHIDVFLAETMSCLEEVCQVVDALSEFYEEENNIMKFDESLATRHPLLVSFTLGADGKIRNGDSVVEVIPKLVDYSNEKGIELIGVMFNCCEPESITKALKEIQTNPQIHHYLHHPPHSVSKIPESTTCGNPDVLQTTTQQIVSSRPQKIFLGAYANRLTPVDPDWTLESSTEAQGMREDLSPERYWNEFVRQWHDEGKVKADIENSSIGGMQLIGGCCGIGPDYIARLKTSLKST